MATKSKKQKQQRRKKRQEKAKVRQKAQLKKLAERQRPRIQTRKPVAWPDEPIVDQAIFSDEVFETLGEDDQQHALSVREALEYVSADDQKAAVAAVAAIPRRSEFSEWRLFVRGCCEWHADHFEEAGNLFSRLDKDRRPGRIATALQISTKQPSEKQTAEPLPPEGSDSDSTVDAPDAALIDAALIDAAQIVRSVRFERSAIQAASKAIKAANPDIDPDLRLDPEFLLDPTLASTVGEVCRDYGHIEPDFTRALADAVLRRAYCSPFVDTFEEVVRQIPGPKHDPRNNLLKAAYFDKSDNDLKRQAATRSYRLTDLPLLKGFSDQMRNALISVVEEQHATELTFEIEFVVQDNRTRSNRYHELVTEALESYERAASAVPENEEAHQHREAFVKQQLEVEDIPPVLADRLRKLLPEIWKQWVQAVPHDSTPRLNLVDHYLEISDLEAVRPHAEYFGRSRHPDPRVRAIPWKIELVRASSLARAKKQMDAVKQCLDSAFEQWPSWISKDYQFAIKAAVVLRAEGPAQLESWRQKHAEQFPSGLRTATMLLSAAQFLKVPPRQLKPLREDVQNRIADLHIISGAQGVHEGIETAAFLWDLSRIEMLPPAHRSIVKKLSRKISDALLSEDIAKITNLNDPLAECLMWIAKHNHLDDSIEDMLLCFSDTTVPHAAIILIGFLANYKQSTGKDWGGYLEYETERNLLNSQTPSGTNAFYDFWIPSLVQQFDDRGSSNRTMFSVMHEQFRDMIGQMMSEPDSFFDDDDHENDVM